jgi:isocitrate dehydrogenase (NAD+)
VGTAGSANIGNVYAMFEAIHGSAPRMVTEGRDQFADPCSIIRAAQMLLEHIGFTDKAFTLNRALKICNQTEKKIVITGRDNGATTNQFTDYLIETMDK